MKEVAVIKLNKAFIKNVFKYTILLFLILNITYFIISSVIMSNKNKALRDSYLKNEQRLVNVISDIVGVKFNRVISDLQYLSDLLNYDYFDESDSEHIEETWKAFSDRKKIYDQIRFIDNEGNEKIRINYDSNGSQVVKRSDLQNKKDRYYFSDTMNLNKGQIYISKFDLNVENGEIENPNKPTIRFSMPVYYDNKCAGIVIINYYAVNLIRDVERISSTGVGDYFLLNSDGYWMYNSYDKSSEWAFMYDDKKELSFSNKYPNEWKAIQDENAGRINTKNGFFSFANAIPTDEQSVKYMAGDNNTIVLGGGNWKLVSFITKDTAVNQLFYTSYFQYFNGILQNEFIAIVFILIISIGVAVLFAYYNNSNEKIKYFSEFDAMTGIYNRRAGYTLLQKSYHDFTKMGGSITVCFVDINGLKDVNDNLGHEAGDELILTIVNCINNRIREGDFISRLGGDEFLIVFLNTNEEQAESVWKRIVDDFRIINDSESRKYIVSASHGIAQFDINSNQYIDTIINLADEKMYDEKRKIKENLKIIRDDN